MSPKRKDIFIDLLGDLLGKPGGKQAGASACALSGNPQHRHHRLPRHDNIAARRVGTPVAAAAYPYGLLRAARKHPSATRQMTIPEPTCIGP